MAFINYSPKSCKLSIDSQLSSKSNPLLAFCQAQSKVLLDSSGFFERVCEALGVRNERGAKASIAQKLSLSKTAIALWEDGEMPGRNSLESIAKVAELSDTSLHWLLTGKGAKEINGTKKAEISVEDVFRKLIREEVERMKIQQLGDVDEPKVREFDLRSAIKKNQTIEQTLEAWFAFDGKEMPEKFGLSFYGWEGLSLEDKIYTVKQIKETIDTLNAEIDDGTD